MLLLGILIGIYTGMGILTSMCAVYTYITEDKEFRDNYNKEIGIVKAIAIIFIIWPKVVYKILRDRDFN
jgi:hypothetical protein